MELTVLNCSIQQDADGRYCLNDLHKAAGGLSKDQPHRWLRSANTQRLIEVVASTQKRVDDNFQVVSTMAGGSEAAGGTFAIKTLVYAYAMWVSPEFQVQVIETFDRVQMEERARLQKSADAYAAISVSEADMLISEAALTLEIPRQAFFKHLSAHLGWIYKKGSKWWPKQKAVEDGFVARRRHSFTKDGEGRGSYQTVITERGMVRAQQGLLAA